MQIKDLGTIKTVPDATDIIPLQEAGGITRHITKADLFSGISSGTNISYASVGDVKSQNTPGGSYTANTIITRVLNTIVANAAWLTLTANAFTLQPGTYIIDAKSPGFKVGSFRAWLQDASANILLLGSGEYSNPGAAYVQSSSVIKGSIIIASAQACTVKFRGDASSGVNYGLGNNASISGQSEIYTQVSIIKIA